MSSRDTILQKIKSLNLTSTPIPTIREFEYEENTLERFKKALEANHVDVIDTPDKIDVSIAEILKGYKNIYSCLEGGDFSTVNDEDLEDKEVLRKLEAVLVNGEIGVAENAAIWIPEQNVKKRILTFVTLHYVVILKKSTVVANMHQAYAQIKDIPGFGVFVAGPSKTADIEQSLVIGAHGPKQMSVVLV